MSRYTASSGPWEHAPRKVAAGIAAGRFAQAVLIALGLAAVLIIVDTAAAHNAAQSCGVC